MPHGLAGGEMSVDTAMARKRRWPSTMARERAERSAQMPTGYEAFSMLAPLM
jgi:hypothetical protein